MLFMKVLITGMLYDPINKILLVGNQGVLFIIFFFFGKNVKISLTVEKRTYKYCLAKA